MEVTAPSPLTQREPREPNVEFGGTLKVALVVMPLAAADRPSLAAGLLKAALARRGFACDVKYFNVTLWKMLGPAVYEVLSQELSMTALAGEWAFAQHFYRRDPSTWSSYRDEVLRHPVWGIAREHDRHVLALREAVPAFLRLALEACDWSSYALVGFTTTFEQTMASLALARSIKERFPRVAIALGGGNVQGSMGRPFVERFPFLDYVSTGEADESLPALCDSLRDGRTAVPEGFLHRGRAVSRRLNSAPVVLPRAPELLDGLPVPDYDDFFRIRAATESAAEVQRLWLPVEASRGCFWAKKSPCLFCGLNGERLSLRTKSAARVLEEGDRLRARYGPLTLQFADSALGTLVLGEVLPAWASRPEPPSVFFEVRPNLTRAQLQLLARAGVRAVQAGVESLSDPALVLMRKGTTAAHNVALMRWGRELGVRVLWNLIYGFPREDPADYARNLAMMQQIVHLPPPSGIGPMRLDRFSPAFDRWREHGFTAIEPASAYGHVFPFPAATLAEMATYFRYEHPRFDEVRALGAGLNGFFRSWRERSQAGTSGELLVRPDGSGGLRLLDTRFTRETSSNVRLTDVDTALLLVADAPVARPEAVERVRAALPGREAVEIAARLGALLSCGAIAEAGSRLVTLALLPDGLSVATLCRAG